MREYLERAWRSRGRRPRGRRARRTCRERLPEALGDYDALLVPAAAGEAPLRSEGHTGDPLLVAPGRCWACRRSRAGMRAGRDAVGVQLVGLDDRALLDAASRVEAGLA